MTNGPGHYVVKDAYVMPVLPKSLKVDPIVAALLHAVLFLEISGEGSVDPDWAVEALEHVMHYLQQLDSERIEELREQVARIAKHARKKKWGKQPVEFLTMFVEQFGVATEDL